jgi:hypothetical protein
MKIKGPFMKVVMLNVVISKLFKEKFKIGTCNDSIYIS